MRAAAAESPFYLGALVVAPAHLVAAFPETSRPTAYAPPGKRIDIGGRSLHIHCAGKGGPTVVLEAGAGDFSLDWSFNAQWYFEAIHILA